MTDSNRIAALTESVRLHLAFGDAYLSPGVDRHHTYGLVDDLILATAERFAAWLNGAVSLHLHAGVVRDQTSGTPSGTPITGGTTMQIHDNEQFTLAAVAADAKGFAVVDALTWSVDDDTVVTLVVADDGQSVTVVAGNPGSAVVTVTDGTLSATEAVDVVAGDVALITLTEGPVTPQA